MSAVAEHFDGTRPNFASSYNGKFRDRNEDVKTAGILTLGDGESVKACLRQPTTSAPPTNIPPAVEKFRNFTDPQLGTIRPHYGKVNDPKYYNEISHGLILSDQNDTAKNRVNPPLNSFYAQKENDLKESIYQSNKRKELGKIPIVNLPKNIDPYTQTFGRPLVRDNESGTLINPQKSRGLVELESCLNNDLYKKTHADFEAGEQKTRNYSGNFNKDTTFGWTVPFYHDGRLVKQSIDWLPTTLLDKRAQVDSKLLEDFREKFTDKLGKPLDPKKETRFIGPDHVFGLNSSDDVFGAADIVRSRSVDQALRGKDKERAYVSSLRSYLARYNLTMFKTLVAAFKFYDQDKDGFISRDELKQACFKINFPVADELVNLLMNDSDYDKDGRLNFLEFSNFLCYKNSMKPGLNYDPNDPEFIKLKKEKNIQDFEIHDSDGRFLLRESDLAPKNNIEVNELLPRTLTKQIDSKIGTWKTAYDLINEAPFRPEPTNKRVYGVPSIRNDLIAPRVRKIQDRLNYGDDGGSWSIIQPSIFTTHGVYEKDVLQPRSKTELFTIFSNIGVNLSEELFNEVWETAKSRNPYGEVSVEEFRSVLDHKNAQKSIF